MSKTVCIKVHSRKYRINMLRFASFLTICMICVFAAGAFGTHIKAEAETISKEESVSSEKEPAKQKQAKTEKLEMKAAQLKTETATIVTESPIEKEMPVKSDSTVKRYMDRSTVTDTSTENYRICNVLGQVQPDGTVKADGRIVVAMGQSYGKAGDKFDITLESGKVLNVIIGDSKRYCDTEGEEGWTAADSSILEFIVDTGSIDSIARVMGDMNYDENYSGRIVSITKVN